MTPVTLGVQVTQVQAVLLAQVNISHSPTDLPGHERPATPGALVVEQDTIARKHPIRLAVVDRDPVRIQLSNTVWAARVERSSLALGSLDDFAVEFGRGGLVEPDVFLESDCADGIKETKGSHTVDVSCVLSHLKGDFDMRLSTKVVNLSRQNLSENVHEVGTVGEITIVEFELVGTLARKMMRRNG
jgi:hypothetical protein